VDIDPYRLVLDAWQDLRRSAGLSDDPRALRDLQPAVRQLREGMKGKERVSFEYGGDLALGYAFAYYPASAAMTRHVLAKSGALRVPQRHEPFRTLVLGAGPAPEILAVDNALQRNAGPVDLEFQLVDSRAGWTPIRRALAARIEAARPDRALRCAATVAGLGSRGCAHTVDAFIPRADLVIMQNVLNELDPATWSGFPERFRHWIRQLRRGSVVIVADQWRKHARERLEQLRDATTSDLELDLDKTAIPVRVKAPTLDAASVIATHLMTTGIQQPRKNVDTYYIVGRRR